MHSHCCRCCIFCNILESCYSLVMRPHHCLHKTTAICKNIKKLISINVTIKNWRAVDFFRTAIAATMQGTKIHVSLKGEKIQTSWIKKGKPFQMKGNNLRRLLTKGNSAYSRSLLWMYLVMHFKHETCNHPHPQKIFAVILAVGLVYRLIFELLTHHKNLLQV